jgi:hypothetical protein
MKELTQVYKSRGKEFINDLFNDYVVVTEKLSGTSFSFCKKDGGLEFFKGNSQRPINLVDRTLMMYYESPIGYIKNVTAAILPNIPDNWIFCFQYFVHNEPGVIKYDRLPKNNLILTHILVRGETGKVAKIIDDPRVIKDWALRLNVTPLQPIYSGYLTKEQKSKIKEFISLPIEDQEELFGTNSFVSYLVNLLGSSIKSTALQNDLSKPIDSIIFKFYKTGTKETFSAKLVDPYTKALMKNKEPEDIRRSPADINEIILLDILAFLEERGLKKHEVLTSTPEERYIELVSAIFNDYVQRRGNDVKNLNFEKADFAKAREFNLNTDFIHNKKTKELVKSSESLKDLYKVMLGSLKKKRDPQKAGAVLTPSVIEDFNAMIDKISNVVNTDVTGGEFKTFNDYLNLKSANESIFTQNDIEDLIKEERISKFNQFRRTDKILIETTAHKETYDTLNEASDYSKLTKRQTNWVKGYEKFSGSNNWIKPKSKISGELLRGEFGLNDGTAEEQIIKYLDRVLKIKKNQYSIEQISKGTYVPDAGGKISSDYDSYAITMLKPTTDAFRDSYKKGDTFYITNRVKISGKTGEAAVIGKKNLTPDAMKLPISEYKDATSLYTAVEKYINSTKLPDNYKEFILQSSMEVVKNQKNNNAYTNFEEYANAKSDYLFYDITDSLFDNIDAISINNFQNDYGEVLGGFMLFNLLNDTGLGLSYPTASNEKLVDFYFDGYSVSSKAGSGGTPTGDTIIRKIESSYKDEKLSFDTIEEQDFYNNVVKQWINPPKLEKSGTYNNIMNLCNVNIPKNMNSGYWYILSKVNVQPSGATRDAIVSYVDELAKDESQFKTVIKEFFDKAGIDQSRLGMDRVYPAYVKQMNANDKNRIGFIFYPLMVEAVNVLNDKYQDQLTKYGQMVTDIKQLYLDVQVKKGLFRFKTVPFKSATFKFEQKGAIPNPFNSNMGIKILK